MLSLNFFVTFLISLVFDPKILLVRFCEKNCNNLVRFCEKKCNNFVRFCEKNCNNLVHKVLSSNFSASNRNCLFQFRNANEGSAIDNRDLMR